MSEKNIIGVDIGTQGTKAAMFSQSGKCLATAFVKSRLYQPRAGVAEEDPEYQLITVCRTIKRCVKQAGISRESVAAIGIDGQMAGVIGIGKNGKNVTVYDSWLDSRCEPYIYKMTKTAGDEILLKTGNAPSFNHGPKILWWMHERKKVFQSISSFVQPSGYAAMRLCGLDAQSAFLDRTYLHFSGFADNQKNKWDAALCDKFGFDMEMLPKIVNPCDIVGQLSSSMARLCGLRGGVEVVAGCGDTAASFLASGATKEGVCVDVAGTASVFAATTGKFLADMKNRVLGCGQSAIYGLWHPYAYINGGGMNMEWFRREIANRGRSSGKNMLSFEQLDRIAEKIAFDENAPLFVPHMAGRSCPSQPHLRGAWVGLSWNHTIAHLYKAILESVALEYGVYRGILAKLYPDLKLRGIHITGGGEKSDLWNSIKATVLQMPVVRLNRSEGAPMGVAMIAGVGAGLFRSLPQVANAWIKKASRCSPDRKLADFYQKRVKKYEALLKSLNDFAE